MVLPNLQSSDLMLVQWSRRLRKALASASAGNDVDFPNTLFVFENGNDTTGLRERLDRPYATLVGALADAQDGDEIVLGPGIFPGSVTIPGTIQNLTISGAGENVTYVTPTAAQTWLTMNTTPGMENLAIRGLTVSMGASPAAAIVINGVTSGGTSFAEPGALEIHHVAIGGGNAAGRVLITAVNQVDIHNLKVAGAGFNIWLDRVGQCKVHETVCEGAVLNTNLVTETVQPSGGVRGTRFTTTDCLNFSTGGECVVVCEDTVHVSGAFLASHPDIEPDVNSGRCEFHGQAGSVELIFNCSKNDSGTFNLTSAIVEGTFEAHRLVGGDGVGRSSILAQNITLMSDLLASVVANDYADLDIRGGFFHQRALTNGGVAIVAPCGTIDRDVHGYLDPQDVLQVPSQIEIHPPFPLYARYGIIIEQDPDPLLPSVLPAATSNKLGGSFDIAATNDGEVKLTLVRPNVNAPPQ